MKKIGVVVFCLLTFVSIKAQKNFEGKIIYALHNDAEPNDDGELTVLFGRNKLKFSFKDKNDSLLQSAQKFTILNIDSGKIYTLRIDDSTYSVKKLKIKENLALPHKKIIAGQPSTPYIQNVKMSLFSGYMAQSNTILFSADTLYYTIPEKYENNMEFIFVENNKVVLGAETYLDYTGMVDDTDTTNKLIHISIEARSIMPMQVNDAEFEIPSYYTNAIEKYKNDAIIDTAKAIMDIADSVVQAHKKPISKKGGHKPPPRKKTTAVKSAAIHRKP